MDEKRQRTNDAAGPSKIPESWNFGRKGKEKTIPAFKLASDIEQQMDLKRVFEERILDSRVDFSLRELLRIAKRGVPRSSRGSREAKKTKYGGKCSKGECEYRFNE